MNKPEVWWPAKRRWRLISSVAMTVAGGLSAALKLIDGQLGLGILALLLASCGAYLLLESARSRVETSVDGIRIVGPFRATSIPWREVAEVRPNSRAPWGVRLVVVKRNGEIVKLLLSPTDEVVDRWKRATSTDSSE